MNRILTLLSFVLILTATGCYKLNHTYILKGTWYLNSLEIDGGSTNFMHGVLPNYDDANGYYRIYMLDNGMARGEYYTADTLNYFVTGEWMLTQTDSIFLKMDNYVDGTFLIELVGKDEMILTSDHNNINFFNIGDTKTVIRVSRDEVTSEDSTKP